VRSGSSGSGSAASGDTTDGGRDSAAARWRRARLGRVAFRLRFALLVISGLAVVSSCGRQQKGKFLIGFSQANLGEPWRVAMNAEIAARAKAFPDLEIVYADAQQDNAKQVADVENFLRQKIDLLIISPNEAKPLTPVVKRAFDAKIPVIVLDREIEGDSYTTFIGANNREIGKAAGNYAVELLKGKGDVVEIKGLPGSTPARDRSEGFREAIAGHPGIRIVHDPVANWLREEAVTQMEAALAAKSHIDLVYAHNDPMAAGAYLAAKAKGRDKEMKFIGIDGLPGLDGGQQLVTDGKLSATFVYPTGGAEAVETASRILHGQPVAHRITLPTRIVSRP
jgi:ribose transport system substrate-binding protein